MPICVESNEEWWKKKLCMFLLLLNYVVDINMKNYKNIAWIDFVNVNIALNPHANEEN